MSKMGLFEPAEIDDCGKAKHVQQLQKWLASGDAGVELGQRPGAIAPHLRPGSWLLAPDS